VAEAELLRSELALARAALAEEKKARFAFEAAMECLFKPQQALVCVRRCAGSSLHGTCLECLFTNNHWLGF
jgi:hypothetical protein